MNQAKVFRDAANSMSSYFRENGITVDVSTADIKELKNSPPPKKIDFPIILFIVMLIFEIIDVIAAFDPSATIGTFWRVIRFFTALSLWVWAAKSIQGIKLIGIQKKALRKALQRFLLVLAANIPMPYVGQIIGVLPVETVFIILTYNYNSKIVKMLWAVIEGDFKNLNIAIGINTNITRTRRGPSIDISQTTAADKTPDGGESKKSTSSSGLSKQDDNLDLRNAA